MYKLIFFIIMLLSICSITSAEPVWTLHETKYIVSEKETLDDITYKFLSDNVPFNIYKEGIISDNYHLLNTGHHTIREVRKGDKLIIHYWVKEDDND